MMRDYGPLLGYVPGLAAGYFGRGALGKQMAAISQRRADRADALMQSGQRGGVPGRIGRTNQFFTEGAPGQPAPFTYAAGRQPYSFTPNPNAPAAEALYRPSVLGRAGPGAAVAGGGALEWGASEAFLVGPAREELQAAQMAVSQDASEANIQRLQAAKDRLAVGEFMANMGRGTLAGALPAELKAQLKYAPARPNVSAAEAERGALDRLLSKPILPPKRRKTR